MANKRDTLKFLHARLRGNYRSKWDADCDTNCKYELEKLFDIEGEQRTVAAVDATIRHEEFFEAAKLWQHLPQRISTRIVSQDCPDCHGCGMKWNANKTAMMTCRCETRTDYKERAAGE